MPHRRLFACLVQDPGEETARKMGRDPVMLMLLLRYMQNGAEVATWEEAVRHPDRGVPLRSGFGMLPQLSCSGLPTGCAMPLPTAQAAYALIMHAAGYPGITSHSEWLV